MTCHEENHQKEVLQEILDRLVAVLCDTGADAQQIKGMKQEFIEQFFSFAERYFRSLQGGDDHAGYTAEALYSVLETIERKCQAKPPPKIKLSYVNKTLPKRYLGIRKKNQSVFTGQTVYLNEPLPGLEEGERIDSIANLDAYNPADVLAAQEEAQEQCQTTSPQKRKLLDMLKELWDKPDKLHQFRDECLLNAPSRQACFDWWILAFEADRTASELTLNKDVLDWYRTRFQTGRASYDTTKKRLRTDLSNFLA